MRCQKCNEETVYSTGLFTTPWGCRKCGYKFAGAVPKNSKGIPIFNTDGTLNPNAKETAEGATVIPDSITVPVVRVTSAAPVKSGLRFPSGEFSQKELAAFNGFDNYKVVWSDLQKLLAKGVLVKASKREKAEGQRGKAAQLFKVADEMMAGKIS